MTSLKNSEKIHEQIRTNISIIDRSLDHINKGNPIKPYAQGNSYATISMVLHDMCYQYIALQEYEKAIGTLHTRAHVSAWLYEKYLLGRDINPQNVSAGDWQSLLVSLLTEDEPLISNFSHNFFQIVSKTDSIYGHTKDSRFIGRYLSALIENNLQEIEALHREKRPSIDRRFFGTYEILDAISHKDFNNFVTSLIQGGEYWEKYMKRYKTEDDAICYLYGACFVKLAERNFKKKINIEIPQFPKQLLEVKSYTPYPLPETIFE
jgi:hypothetical protein